METPTKDAGRELASETYQLLRVHIAWAKVMELCRDIGYGELERIKIQDGVPVMAEVARRRVKLV